MVPEMTDAEKLMARFHNLVAEAPTRIAPERDHELLFDVFGGKTCELFLKDGEANFFANLEKGSIEARFAALLSLWATAHACLDLADQAARARESGQTRLSTTENPTVQRAYRLLAVAKSLIADYSHAWPDELPVPDVGAAAGTPAASINNLFLGATAWALLHEVGHLKLGHAILSNTEREQHEEFEADDWAARWVLEKTPSAEQQEFRVFSIAVALVWLQLVEDVRGTDHIHPPAFERLARCSNRFPYNDDSPALAMAGDVLKLVFDPRSEITAAHAGDAFASVAIRLARGQHMTAQG